MAWNGRHCSRCGSHHASNTVQAKDCHSAYQREWRRDRKAWEAKDRETRFQRLYGIGLDEYERMLKAQHGACAICGRLPGQNRLSVDHCHDTGRVRGLLCINCNTNLTWLESHGDRAKEYLR